MSKIKFKYIEGFLCLSLALFTIGTYNFLFFNKFFPITEGWFSTYSHLFNSGLMPYKDFYLYITPLYPLIIHKFQLLFGESFFALRLLGFIVILAITFLLYSLLSRRFNPYISSFCTAISIIYYQSGVAHIQYDFIQFLTLFTLLGLNFLDLCCDDHLQGERQKYLHLFLYFSGISFALTFLIKQSNGAFILLSSFLAILIIAHEKFFTFNLKKIFFFCAGVFFPLLFVLIWLYLNESLKSFFDQIFYGAIQSKGSLTVILSSWLALFNKLFFKQLFYTLLFIAPLFSLDFFLGKLKNSTNSAKSYSYFMIGPILLIPFFIFLGWHSNFIDSGELANVIREKINYEIVVISTSLVLFQFLCAFYPFDSRVFNHKNLSILIIIEIGMFFGNGTSAGLSEISAFLGFAYFLGYLLSLSNVKVLSSLFVSLLCLCLITFLVAYKFDKPYSWWYVSTDRVQNSTDESRQPALKGILLNSKDSEDIDQIVNTIRFNSAPNDDVFVFPNIQGLYALSNRMPKSKVIVSWFDFLPDQVAIEEADRLIRHPPKLIVDFDMPEIVWEAHERLFRNGKVIGQRAIKKSILELTSNNMQFKLIYRKKLRDGCQISIWKNRR